MTTAIAPANEVRLAIAETETEDLAELIEANLGETGFSAQDLDRVKVPSGGQTVWTIPGIDGDSHGPELIGVVAHWHARKAYWAKSMEDGGGGSAPDCYSEDLKTGIGKPGGPCARCPFNQFGSATRGEGKACKDIIQLFLVRGDDILPTVVSVPASSIGNIRQYFLRLVGKKAPYYAAITRLALNATRSKSGVAYSEIVPSLVRVLNAEELARVKRYAEAIRACAATVSIADADPDAGPDGDVDFWRRTAMARYAEHGGDPADQEQRRSDFAEILGCAEDRSCSEYTMEEWAEVAIHYSGPVPVPNEAPAPDGKGHAAAAVQRGETGMFSAGTLLDAPAGTPAQQRGA